MLYVLFGCVVGWIEKKKEVLYECMGEKVVRCVNGWVGGWVGEGDVPADLLDHDLALFRLGRNVSNLGKEGRDSRLFWSGWVCGWMGEWVGRIENEAV